MRPRAALKGAYILIQKTSYKRVSKLTFRRFDVSDVSSSSGTAIRWPFPTMKSKKTKRGANLDHFAAADITFKAIKFKNYGSR